MKRVLDGGCRRRMWFLKLYGFGNAPVKRMGSKASLSWTRVSAVRLGLEFLLWGNRSGVSALGAYLGNYTTAVNPMACIRL